MGTTIKAMLNTDRVCKDGRYPLVVRIIHNRRKKMIYTPYHLFKKNFDFISQKVVLSDDGFLSKQRCDEINRYLKDKKMRIDRILLLSDKTH